MCVAAAGAPTRSPTPGHRDPLVRVRGARFAGAGWEAGLARRVRTDSAPPHFVTQAPWGRPPSATTDRCPCRCPCCSPLGLRFRVTARGVLGKSSGSFCFEPGPDLSHGEEETGILLGCEDGIRGSAFLGFGVPSHWRESQAKGSCACTAGVDHARVGGSLRGCPGPPFPLRAEAPWTRSAAPCCAVPCSGPARHSHAPAGLRGVRAQQPAVPRLRRTARNDTRPLNAPDRRKGLFAGSS